MNFRVKSIKCKSIEQINPIHVFEKYQDLAYSSCLTGNGINDISQYSFIGVFPHTIINYDKSKFNIRTEFLEEEYDEDFWNFLKKINKQTEFHKYDYPINKIGAIGYLSYDLLHEIENIEEKTESNYLFPKMQMILFNKYFLFDHIKNKAFEIDILYFEKSCINIKQITENRYSVSNLEFECSKNEYMGKVEKIKNYIIEGDIYEVNLSQQIKGDFKGNPFILFKDLYKVNEAPFSAYMCFEDYQIVCNSPELFLRCNDRIVETRPIKGTAPRGENETEDEKNRDELLKSSKNQAELYMIIDLLRNDLGKVCEYNSVIVKHAKRLEEYQNVYHLVGIVEGKLKEEYDYVDLIKATFPGGSITGCPKIRSMEIIEELEKYQRHLYTGSIFIMNSASLISNIVIRSAIVRNNKIFLNSGGAITIDSDALEEFEEINHKIKSFLQVFNR